ncbi:hypothetical protein [Novosphingobium mathurense]|uniref:Uncharacterized protein n=1 Tax=Novosphingobium mathurense TaxID=428990 RepID=A0A1U6IHE5_9SPHN|nr:hypothetical protein [Novosphingobium mathurense]SLK07446.1 hypothetical protein SAMN06295987_106240 [Novosphingobium mathurense]
MASIADERSGALTFWQKMAIGIAAFILFGFLQWTARGFVDIARVPVWIHIHALVMVSWLGLFIYQPTLIKRGDPARHRRFGRIGMALAALIVILGSFASIMTIRTDHVPPFFTPAYFLALNHVGLALFAAMLVAAIVNRHDTQMHRRLIVGANVLLMEPAYGRMLPMPLLAPWGETVGMLIQLGTLAIVARHDRATLGSVHRATLIAIGVVAANHALYEAMGRTSLMAELAARITGGG